MFQELPERHTRQTPRRDNRQTEREREWAGSGQDAEERRRKEASGSRVTVCFTSFFFLLFFSFCIFLFSFCIFFDQFYVVTNYQLLALVVFALPRRVPAHVQQTKLCVSACVRYRGRGCALSRAEEGQEGGGRRFDRGCVCACVRD